MSFSGCVRDTLESAQPAGNSQGRSFPQKYTHKSHSRPSFQILFNLCGVCAIKPLQFLIKLGVSLIDKVYIGILVMSSPTAVLSPLFNPATTRTMCESHYDMSRIMRKPAFCICENKGADELHGNHAADQLPCFCYIDSTIPLMSSL